MHSSPSITGHFRLSILASVLAICSSAPAATIAAAYSGSYTLTDLGPIAGVVPFYGGLTLLAGDNNTLLIGGSANNGAGKIYQVGITRDAGGHITGFLPNASVFATAPNIDGGLAYGPGGVLFFTGYPTNELGQIKPGSTTPDKTLDLDVGSLIGSSVGSLAFVPAGHNGAGQMKMVSYNTYKWYSVGLSPDGSGTYDISSATLETTLVGGPEGIAYVPLGSAGFANPSVLVAEYQAGRVAAYQTDANGDPIVGTRTDFITGLGGAEGAFIDPVTGDFLFSTFGGGDTVVRVSGFVTPPAVPDAVSTALLLVLAAGGAAILRRRHE